MHFKTGPGFLSTLQSQLEKLPYEKLQLVDKSKGLELQSLIRLLLKPQDYSVDSPDPIPADEIVKYDSFQESLFDLGLDAIENGHVAYCILAGGAGTRIGASKATLKIPGLDISLLGIKLIQSVPSKHVWIMTSPSNDDEIKSHFSSLTFKGDVKLFQQYQSFRLTPDNCLHLENDEPSLYPCGHGDVIPALKESGLLDSFLAQGGKYVVIVNADNVLASLDPALIGHHIQANKPVTCEVVEKLPNDSGGLLCNVAGVKQIVEQFRMTGDFDASQFNWLNTNSMIIDADLNFDSIRWSWHRVKKNINGKLIIQYERLLQDLTSTFQTSYVEVPRYLRFMPIKTNDDLTHAYNILNGNR